jgi:hypothetical protein
MNYMDLPAVVQYHLSVNRSSRCQQKIRLEYSDMKLALRIFAFAIVVAGAAAASVSSPSHTIASHQSATGSALPIPGCGPGMGCMPSGR